MHVAVIFEHSRQTAYQLFNSCSSAALASSDRVVNRLGNGRNGDLLSAHPDQIIYYTPRFSFSSARSQSSKVKMGVVRMDPTVRRTAP